MHTKRTQIPDRCAALANRCETSRPQSILIGWPDGPAEAWLSSLRCRRGVKK